VIAALVLVGALLAGSPGGGDAHWARAQDGEGLIALTTRVCGNPDRWPAVAFANFIDGPDYPLRTGQRLLVVCTSPAIELVAPVITRVATPTWGGGIQP
jgi:hypothetical protein